MDSARRHLKWGTSCTGGVGLEQSEEWIVKTIFGKNRRLGFGLTSFPKRMLKWSRMAYCPSLLTFRSSCREWNPSRVSNHQTIGPVEVTTSTLFIGSKMGLVTLDKVSHSDSLEKSIVLRTAQRSDVIENIVLYRRGTRTANEM
jgi:hypothetical protein